MSALGSRYIKNFSERTISGFRGICYQCDFCTDLYLDPNVTALLDGSAYKSIGKAVAKRKSEFVAGRYLAHKALLALGADNTTVGVGVHREPLWPTPFVGSISHSKEFAICAVANRCDVMRVGIDVEDLLSMEVARDIIGSILLESEYKFVGTYTDPDPIALTLIFSAKESLFKALYPEVGHYFGFEAAQTKAINFQTNTFTLELVHDITPTLSAGTCFEGLFELGLNKVFTMLT